MCTIATAKVQRNYNCYNVYFNECLRINAMMERTKETSEAAGLSLETGGFAFMVSDMDGYLLLLSADYRLLARRISFRGAKDIKTRLVDGIQLMTLQIVDGLAI